MTKPETVGTVRERERERELQFSEQNNNVLKQSGTQIKFNKIIKSKNRKIAYFCLFCVWQI